MQWKRWEPLVRVGSFHMISTHFLLGYGSRPEPVQRSRSPEVDPKVPVERPSGRELGNLIGVEAAQSGPTG